MHRNALISVVLRIPPDSTSETTGGILTYKESFNVGGYECNVSEGKLFIQGSAYADVPEEGCVSVYQQEGKSGLEVTLRDELRTFLERKVVDPRAVPSQEPGLTATTISP